MSNSNRDLVQLLVAANEAGVAVWRSGDELHFRTERGRLPLWLREQLSKQKDRLLGYLKHAGISSAHTQMLPNFRRMPWQAQVPSFRQATWDGIKNGQTGVDSSNCRYVVRITSDLTRETVERALETILQRYPVLSATVVELNNSPCLCFSNERRPRLEWNDLSSMPASDREARARELAGEHVWQAMDLGRGPLFKPFLIALRSGEEHVFGFVIHHLIADTITVEILVREFVAFFADPAQIDVQQHHHPQIVCQYTDYLLAMTEWQQSGPGLEQLAYWEGRLADVAPMQLSDDSNAGESKGSREYFSIGEAVATRIGDTSRRLGATDFLVLLAVQNVLLAGWLRVDRVTIGGVISGRDHPSLEATVGYLADRVYWHTDLSGDPTFSEVVTRTRAAVEEAKCYQFVRSDIVKRRLREVGRPICAPIFNFHPFSARESPSSSNNSTLAPFAIPPAPFATIPAPDVPYWMALAGGPEGMHGHMRYPGQRVDGLLAQFVKILSRAVDSHRLRVSELIDR